MLVGSGNPLEQTFHILSLVSFVLFSGSSAFGSIDATSSADAIQQQIEEAQQNTRKLPNDANAFGILGMTLQAYERYDSAILAYQKAHLLDPHNFDWLYLQAIVQMDQGSFRDAEDSLQSALRITPAYLPAKLRLAQAFSSTGNPNQAQTIYQRIVSDDPTVPQGWYGLGRVRASQGDHAAAVEALTKACDLFSAYGASHLALARELRKLGNSSGAEQHLQAYSSHAADEPPLNDPVLRRMRALNQSTAVHLRRSVDFEKAGDLENAIKENEAALSADASNVQAHVNLISLYGRVNNPAKAREHFYAATQLNPGFSDAWYNYGVLLFEQANFGEAESAFRKAIAINPQYAEAHNNLGAIFEQQGHLNQAEVEFRAAIEDRPNYPLARFHLGRLLVNQQKYDEAIQQLLRSFEPASDQTPLYLYALGAAYARAGDRKNALEYFQKAHAAAADRGQSQLLSSIDRDLKRLKDEP